MQRRPSAASPSLLKHTGRAVVFESPEEMHAAVDDENLDVDESCIMVLKNCGPKGYPGMAEVGNLPLPRKLLRRGSFASVDDLRAKVLAFIDYFNRTMAKPFKWTYQGKPLHA